MTLLGFLGDGRTGDDDVGLLLTEEALGDFLLFLAVLDIALLMDFMSTGSDEGVEFMLLEDGFGDEIGEVDVGKEVVLLLDVFLAVDAGLTLLRLLLKSVVLLQHQLLVLPH